VASALEEAGVTYTYEQDVIKFEQPAKQRRYTPDFVLPNGIILEVKGYLTSADRMKHKWIKEQHPEMDIRFVFMNPNTRISSRSKTRYKDWADKLGYPWCCGPIIPHEWTQKLNP
jgi:hypothetical protein